MKHYNMLSNTINQKRYLFQEDEFVKFVIDICLDYFNISQGRVFSQTRDAHTTYIRHVIFYMLMEYTGLRSQALTKYMKYNRHTIQHGQARIKGFKDVYNAISDDITNLREKICNNITSKNVFHVAVNRERRILELFLGDKSLSCLIDAVSYLREKHKDLYNYQIQII